MLLALVAASALSVALVVGRELYTGRASYRFLIWNLFLAWVPLGFALAARAVHAHTRQRWAVAPLGAAWLFFFPNAPYIITDLMHLRTTRGGPLWVDLLMVFSCAWSGLIVGLFSLRLVHRIVDDATGRAAPGWLFAVSVSFLAGVGVYLGRFERWNSWDIVTRPGDVLSNALQTLTGARAVTFSLVTGAIVLLAYLTACALSARAAPSSHPETPEATELDEPVE